MSERFARTMMIFGAESMDKLAASRVAVFGIGGVGGYVAEALARSGIGAIDIIDNDTVDITNINRQIIATQKTLGRLKTEVFAERIKDISPDCKVMRHDLFYLPDNQGDIDMGDYDYVVDAVDTVTAKLLIIENAKAAGVPVISSMGTGNKTDPSALSVADLYETSVCPLAKVMRHECRKRGITELTVVYSKEEPASPVEVTGAEDLLRRSTPGSTAFVPAAAGLLIASKVVKDLICDKD